MKHMDPFPAGRVSALIVLAAGLWTACTLEPEPDPEPPILVPSRILSIRGDAPDTAVTLLRYDAQGILIREIRETSFREWDSLGRYKGIRVKDSARYLEKVEWITADSAVRTQGATTVIHERFFNRRINCWCADSIRQTFGDTAIATRIFLYDAEGNPMRVHLTYRATGRLETVQVYDNFYGPDGRLIQVTTRDIESGALVVTKRLFEYDTLKNVMEAR